MQSPPIRKIAKKKVRAVRHPAAFPVTLGPKKGLVKDISATGIYFEIDQKQAVGSNIEFVLDLETPGGPMQVQCHGTVVRIEKKAGKVGIAATIEKSIFKNK